MTKAPFRWSGCKALFGSAIGKNLWLNLTRSFLVFSLGFLASLHSGCTSPESVGKLDGAIRAQRIRAHLQILSDDLMEGRAPGRRGGELAAKYIASQFQAAGLQPAVGDSSYFQNVPLVGLTPSVSLRIRGLGRFWNLIQGAEFTARSRIEQPKVLVRNKEMVFVGYGIDAPEYRRNDYSNIDVTGKVVLILMNEPHSQDSTYFGGRALTYYGFFKYKLEEAVRKGAEGAILIHTPTLATVPWYVIGDSGAREQLFLRSADDSSSLSFEAAINQEVAKEILAATGHDLEQLIQQANGPDFKPVELQLRVTAAIVNEIRYFKSPNVIAKLPGHDPNLKEECIIYTSHYDHLGKIESKPDDGIFNGALDNASGAATLIELAHAFSEIPFRPKRTLLFAAVTAEEAGLLGSQYYTTHPIYPLAKTAANINLDGVNVWGRTYDVTARGAERSSLQMVIERVTKEMRMTLSPDPFPESGFFFRSDQFSFAKVGVPAVHITSGLKYVGKSEGWSRALFRDYVSSRYHSVADEYDPSWSFEGAEQIAQLVLKTGLYLANDPSMPEWKAGEPFKRMVAKR